MRNKRLQSFSKIRQIFKAHKGQFFMLGFVVKLDGLDLYEDFQHSENVILTADNETIPLVLEVLPYIDDETEEQYIVIHYRELLNDGINLYEWALAIKGDFDFKVSA